MIMSIAARLKEQNLFRFSALALMAFMSVGFLACPDTEIITVERPFERNRIGEDCVVADDCESGRCIGGICGDDQCEDNDDCLSDELCVFGECVPADEFACSGDERPLAQINPLEVEFGEVALGNTAETTVTIENVGDCLLTLEGIGLASNTDQGFGCAPCDPTEFPQRIPPGRSLDLDVNFTPPGAGEAFSQIIINTDDESAGEDGIVEVNLHASYSGVPRLIINPLQLSFGFVQQGSSRTETFRITNEGSGNATLHITGLFIGGADRQDFTIPDEFALVSPADPILLPPYNPNDEENTVIEIPVTLSPLVLRNLSALLNVQAHSGDPTAAVISSAELSGSSLGPPAINIAPERLVFRQDDGDAIAVGNVAFKQVTINNTGQSDLTIDMSLFDPSGDFSISPPFIPPVAAGGTVVVSVFYNPSEPSDAVTPQDPQSPVNASLNITSNDDDPAGDVLKQVALEGWARGGVFDDVLKLEMTFQNADNSWAGNDYRDVDLEVISPTGFSCAKPVNTYADNGMGGFIVTDTEDLCDDWNAFGQEGTVNWIGLGQYQEPERVILHSLGQENAEGGLFTARALYIEDCANIPTGVLGDILGIAGSVLLGVLGGAVGVPISVPPDQISDLVSENCWDRDSTLVTLHVFINGEEVASPQHRLRRKGDCGEMVRLRRENGQFIIESSSPAACN